MPIKIEDVAHIEEMKTSLDTAIKGLNTAISGLNTGITSAFGELSFALLTVIEAHNKLEQRLDTLEQRLKNPSSN